MSGSVTMWLVEMKAGDGEAAQKLWERYVRKLISRARQKLHMLRKATSDEEDVVQSAFAVFFQCVEQGRFPKLNDRGDLWQILLMLVDRKSVDLLRRERAGKRGGGRVRGDSVLAATEDSASNNRVVQSLIDGEPTPEFAAIFAEEFERLLDALENDELRSIAIKKMECDTNNEIAHRLGVPLRTVERKLALIRRMWREDASV